MGDVDRFKSINDPDGHQAGDEILREAARRMKSAMRAYDVAGRYGGEESLAVLPGCCAEDARAQAERIRASFAGESFRARGEILPVTCSFGVSWREVAASSDADAVMREADTALYAAKANGQKSGGVSRGRTY